MSKVGESSVPRRSLRSTKNLRTYGRAREMSIVAQLHGDEERVIVVHHPDNPQEEEENEAIDEETDERYSTIDQQKKHWLQTDRQCVRTQEICLEHPVRPAHPQRALADWLHPSPLGAIQPASCPPSAPGWAISHANLLKNTKVSDQWGFALGISLCP